MAEIRRILDIAEESSSFLFDETVNCASPINCRLEDSLHRIPSQESDEMDVDRHLVAHIPTWLGFAAGAIRVFAKTGLRWWEVARRDEQRTVRCVWNEGASAGDASLLRQAGKRIHIRIDQRRRLLTSHPTSHSSLLVGVCLLTNNRRSFAGESQHRVDSLVKRSLASLIRLDSRYKDDYFQ